MISNPLSRRHFLGTAVAAATGFTLPRFASAAEKPNSVFNGVRIGCITYSYRSMAKTAEETLKALLDDGLSETELMGGPIQTFAGIKAAKPPMRSVSSRSPSALRCGRCTTTRA
jgi:hypothetical protein